MREISMVLLGCTALAGAPAIGALAQGGDPGQIHACVNNSSKVVRIVGESEACKSIETPLVWNIQGPGVVIYEKVSTTELPPTPPGTGHGTDIFCDHGDRATGGGFSLPPISGLVVLTSQPDVIESTSGEIFYGWQVLFQNTTSSNVRYSIRVLCVDLTP